MWIAVDRDGEENIFSCKPKRWNNGICSLWTTKGVGTKTSLKKGTIKKETGKDITWIDGCLCLKSNKLTK